MPPSQPGAPAGAQPGQPPFGSSPATAPTQNRGMEAAGLQALGMALKVLEKSLSLLGATSEAGLDVMDAIKKLAKHVPTGAVGPAGEKNQLQSMMIQQQQQGPQIAAMRAQQGAGAGQAGAAPPPQAAAA